MRIPLGRSPRRAALLQCDANCGKRAELLAAYIDVLLAKGDVGAARAAAAELKALATTVDAVLLRALMDRAEGSSPKDNPARQSLHCAGRGEPGKSWKRRTRLPGSAC